jgi:hypothetical protein
MQRYKVAADIVKLNNDTQKEKERTTMTYVRRICLVVVALLALLIAVPGRASATSLVPFQATVTMTQTVAVCSAVPSVCVTIKGTGHATDMGQIKVVGFVVSNLASNAGAGCHTEMQELTLTAANDDKIAMDATGVNCSTGKTTGTSVDSYQVVGGTGRFSRARGSGTVTASFIIGKTSVATYSGLLSTPGSLQ